MTRLPERPQPQLLNERLQRCDAAIAASDRAQRLRDQLLERHDRAAADAIAYGRALPATDPALNLAEIQLRSAKGAERAALMAREGIQAELQAINVQLGVVGQQIREQVCADMLPACALLCEGLERSLGVVAVDRAGFDSVADYLHRLAVTHANGGEVTATPEG